MDDDQTRRSPSPSKRRRKGGSSLSGRSALRTGSIVLSERTVFTATSSVKRTASPSRHLTELRTAQPSISLAPITMPPQPLLQDTMTCLAHLRRQLGTAIKDRYIPGGLKHAIEQDPDFRLSLSMEPFDEVAFDYDDTRSPHDLTLVDVLRRVKGIFQSAGLCSQCGKNENAWCFGVIWPLIELAVILHGKGLWRPESVQSQGINLQYLSYIAHSSTPSEKHHLFRKTDFCFSYSCLNPRFRVLYERLEAAGAIPVSHTTDNFTSRAVLFSGIEVKPETGTRKKQNCRCPYGWWRVYGKRWSWSKTLWRKRQCHKTRPVPLLMRSLNRVKSRGPARR
ncbi:hypothetical protein BU25DRAFT_485471 [Macroventuria anomochaeta]|uniref:Uncharacterized protein n=1 Tax=Macroventuria anomochaeta TaxID=301207 RepID=A0ACB6S5N7_9PLEO|nr:uncharacterized protein BU25DRAFT_485471 [Macroventuria anomochaeta]KAF2629550.1 hypothetical protein BU25DRAFT_485471 [Macroventuria anomochaeta]